MKIQKCPRRLGGQVAGEYRNAPHYTRSVPSDNISVEDLGVAFAAEALEAERICLSMGWLDPIGLNNAAYDAGLNGRHFSTLEHSFVFAYCCCCAAQRHKPVVREVSRLAKDHGLYLPEDDVFSILIPPLSVIEDGRIGEYVAAVIDFAHRRDESRELQRRAVELFAGDDYEVIVRRRERGHGAVLRGRIVA